MCFAGRRPLVAGGLLLTVFLSTAAAAQTLYVSENLRWHRAPKSVSSTEQYAQTTLYVVWPGQPGEARLFGRADCTLLKDANVIKISNGDGRALYLGWTSKKMYTDGGYDADYRLVFSTVEKSGEQIPGKWKHVEGVQGGLRVDGGLEVNGKVYLPVEIENGNDLIKELEAYKTNVSSH